MIVSPVLLNFSSFFAMIFQTDPYSRLYELEEEDAVSSVMKNMMKKEVVKDKFKYVKSVFKSKRPL